MLILLVSILLTESFSIRQFDIFFFAELDSVEETSIPHNKIIDCLTSCIQVAHINDILQKQKELMHIYAAFLLPEYKWTGILDPSYFVSETCLNFFLTLSNNKIIFVQSKLPHFYPSKNFVQGSTMS